MKRYYCYFSMLFILPVVFQVGCEKSVGVQEPEQEDEQILISDLQIISGNGQTGLTDTLLPEPLLVKVINQHGEPVSAVPVNWSVVEGNGSIDAQEATDSNGLAQAEWTLGPFEGTNRIQVEVEGIEAVVFIASGVEEALTLTCQPDIPVVPQDASGTLVCSVSSIFKTNDPISLSVSSIPENIQVDVYTGEDELTSNVHSMFLLGISATESAVMGDQTVEILATDGKHHISKNLILNISSPRPTVNVIYLVPSDKTARSDYRNAMELATRHLQIWFYEKMGNQRAFALSNPVVKVYHSSNNTDWYATNELNMDKGLWFWYNVVNEGFSFTGGEFFDENHIWIFYIEAEPACGQLGGAATASVAVLPANDPRGLVGEQMIPYCPNEGLDNRPPCGWVGGFGHELGHAMGLPHPPGCDNGSSDCDYQALMWGGFRDYPHTYLRNDEIQSLNQTPFITESSVSELNFNCNNFSALGSAQSDKAKFKINTPASLYPLQQLNRQSSFMKKLRLSLSSYNDQKQ